MGEGDFRDLKGFKDFKDFKVLRDIRLQGREDMPLTLFIYRRGACRDIRTH